MLEGKIMVGEDDGVNSHVKTLKTTIIVYFTCIISYIK